jgi:hypothetical protein
MNLMLHAWTHPHTGELRLYVQGTSAEAWISAEMPSGQARHGRDWVLWVRSGGRLTLENCQARLQVQSLLRAWLLQRYHRPLLLMSFDELHRLACESGRRSETKG